METDGRPGIRRNARKESDSSLCTRPPRQTLNKKQRLTSSALFRETYDQKTRWFGDYMVYWVRSGPQASLRLGVVAGRKVGKAVQRNRARRVLREVFRKNRARLSGEVDVILIARRAVVQADWDAVEREFMALSKKAGLLTCVIHKNAITNGI